MPQVVGESTNRYRAVAHPFDAGCYNPHWYVYFISLSQVIHGVKKIGFNHKIDSLNINDTQNEVHQALVELLRVANESRFMRVLCARFPVLKWIVRVAQKINSTF